MIANVLGATIPTIGFPRKPLKPVPKIVNAKPLTTWFARKEIVRNACIEAIAPPAAAAAITPNQGFP